MAVNGKNKGNSFERKMANLLSERFKQITGVEQAFRRNPDSGSFFGGTNQKRTATHDLDNAFFGDLICPKDFKFAVECKHYKNGPTFAALVKGKVAQWDEWLGQARQDAASSNKKMMLIIKYNGIEEIVFLEEQLLNTPVVVPYSNVYGYHLTTLMKQQDTYFF